MTGGLQDIIQDSLERDRGHIYQMIVLLGPRIELCPDLSIVPIQYSESLPDPWPVKHRRVGNDHDFQVAEASLFLRSNGQLHHFFEARIGRRLTIAAEGDVLHLAERRGDAGEGVMLNEVTRASKK